MPDEGIEGDGIETDYAYDLERQEMDEGPDIDDIESSANNEVEIEDVSEVPNQSADAVIGQSSQIIEPSTARLSENQQQIQSISSGSGNGNGAEEAGPSTSGATLSPSATSQWRQSPNAPTSRQQAQHLMLMSQTFQDEASDDRIVPSTPTLYRSRGDGFSEVVSSPHPATVPHARSFVFGESSSSSSSSSRQMIEGMDETRIDLSEDGQIGSGRNVPNLPQHLSPMDTVINDSTSASTSSTSSSISTVIQQDLQQEQPVAGSSGQEESQVPEISITGADDGEFWLSKKKIIMLIFFDSSDFDGASTSDSRDESGKLLEEQDIDEGGDGVSSEGEKPPTTETNEVRLQKIIVLAIFTKCAISQRTTQVKQTC